MQRGDRGDRGDATANGNANTERPGVDYSMLGDRMPHVPDDGTIIDCAVQSMTLFFDFDSNTGKAARRLQQQQQQQHKTTNNPHKRLRTDDADARDDSTAHGSPSPSMRISLLSTIVMDIDDSSSHPNLVSKAMAQGLVFLASLAHELFSDTSRAELRIKQSLLAAMAAADDASSSIRARLSFVAQECIPGRAMMRLLTTLAIDDDNNNRKHQVNRKRQRQHLELAAEEKMEDELKTLVQKVKGRVDDDGVVSVRVLVQHPDTTTL